MKRALLTGCLFVAAMAGFARADSVVGPEVRGAVALDGRVRVMVVFDVAALRGARAPARGSRAEAAAIRAVRDALEADLSPSDFAVDHRFEHVNALAGSVDARGLARLERHPLVLRVDLDAGGEGQLVQSLPLTGVSVVKAVAGLTGAGVTVAVLDSGIDGDHPDLSDDLVGEACFCSGGGGCCPGGGSFEVGVGSAEDDHGHGTNVTGVITSAGGIAPEGGAPDASIVAVKVLDRNNTFCCTSDVVAGLDWLITNRPDVDLVNMSLGTFALYAGDCDAANATTLALSTAIGTLRSGGVTVFVSSGNDGSGTFMQAPACVADAISVGAVWDATVGSQTHFACTDPTTAADRVTCFTNSNASTDLMAPGAPMGSTGLGGITSTYYGTSQASPIAAACAALLLENDPGLTPAALEAALESSTTLVTDATNGLAFPRVDCVEALATSAPAVPALGPGGVVGCVTALVASMRGSATPRARRRRRDGVPHASLRTWPDRRP